MTEIALDIVEQSVRDLGGPKYRRVVSAFESAIRQGDFRPGDRVPNETELSARLPLSLGTLQKAMRTLTNAGLLVRNRRTGTFIADRMSQVDEVYVYRFRDPATGALLMPSTRVLGVTLDETPGPWADALGADALGADALGADASGAGGCVRVDRLVWVERDPPAFNALYLSRDHGAHMLDMPVDALHGSSCHRVMAETFDLPTLRMDHGISCRRLSDRACDYLRVPRGEVGLVWDVRDYSIDDVPVLFQRFEMLQDHRPMELIEIRGETALACKP